jgi:hypothetical protein
MVTVDMPFHLGNETKLKVDVPEFGDRVPSRQFRKSRTFINSKRETKRSKEHKEPEPMGIEPNFANKGSQKGGLGTSKEKPDPPKKEQKADGVTLDKVLGGSYQAIELHAIQDISNDIFPSRPGSRRGRSKQRNFDIMEADEEDENHESVRDLKEKMDSIRHPTEECTPMNRTNFAGFGFADHSQKIKSTIVNLNKTDRTDTSRERVDPTKTTYQTKYPQPSQKKKLTANSQSPRIIKEYSHFPPSKNYIKTEENLGISPLKTFGNKFNRMPATTIYNPHQKNENSYLMVGANLDDFAAKGKKKLDKKSQEALVTDLFKTHSNIGAHEDLSAERTTMGFRAMEENKRFAKENRLLNQKSVIDEKFKDEDNRLFEKYGARFGINPEELDDFGKMANQNIFHQPRSSVYNAMNLTKRISTPFAEPKRYDTFYRSKRFQNGYN